MGSARPRGRGSPRRSRSGSGVGGFTGGRFVALEAVRTAENIKGCTEEKRFWSTADTAGWRRRSIGREVEVTGRCACSGAR